MKKLPYLFFCLYIAAFGQNTVTDIDGNTYNYLSFGDQKWTTENAAMETYRDGTPIPRVTDTSEWVNLTTGAWCYLNNDPNTEVKLYNWFAVVGIHDTDPNTPNKEFAPEGWHVPSLDDWIGFENYLIDNGYNYDGSTTDNKIAKAMASTTGWNGSATTGDPGNNQNTNNNSEFNAFPFGFRGSDIVYQGQFVGENEIASFWTTTESNGVLSYYLQLMNGFSGSITSDSDNIWKQGGMSVRFLKGVYTLIPDPNFEQALIDQDIDTNPIIDGQVLTASISGLLELNVQNLQIADLTGIEDFTALTDLNCQGNQLTRLDVSNNTALEILRCSSNQLTSLDVINNTALRRMFCENNQLTSLDVSGANALTDLICGDNQLTSLDMSGATALNILFCENSQLTSLDVRNGNNEAFFKFFAGENPNLACIYVDDADYSNANWSGGIDPASTFVENEAECEALSIGDNALELDVFIYPNPTDNYLFVEGNKNPISISIYNLLGAEVIAKSATDKINVSELSKGVYIIRISDGVNQTNKKFIKN